MLSFDSNHTLQLVLDSTPDGITVQRPDGSLLYANAAAARLLGFASAKALIDTPIGEVVSRFEMADENGEPFPTSRLPGRLAMQGLQHPEEALIRFRRLDDDAIYWSIVGARPVFDEDGALLFVVNTFRFVTDYMRVLQNERETRHRAEEAESRLTFLARSSEILAESLDYDKTLKRVSQLAVPEIADWCAVDLNLDTLERVSVAHVDPKRVELAYELHHRFPPRKDAPTGLYQVLRTGQPEIYPKITEEMLVQAVTDEEHLRLLRQIDLHALLIVPLKVRERVLGAITLASGESGRTFTDKDLELASELARRAALAVENARLYAEARQLNSELEERVSRRTAALRQTNRRLQKKIEEVQQAEYRFRTLLESAPDAMVIIAQDGTIRLVNSQAQTLFGYPRADLVGMPVEMLMPAGLRNVHVDHRHQYAREPRTRPMGAGLDLRAQHKDGHEIPVEISLSPLESEGETLYIATVRDVSERRRAEEQLRRSEMQLAEAQAIAHLGSWEWDLKTDTFSWSREMFRVFGIDPHETSPSYRAFLARVHPEDRARVAEAVRAAQERGIPFSTHHRLLLDHGVTRTVHAQGTVETDDQGNVLRIVATSQDITMQKEMDEELRRSEALYRAMAENLPNGSVLVVDRDMRYQLARGPGLDFDDISTWEGKTVAEVAPDEAWRERVAVRYRDALQGKTRVEEVRRNGRVFMVQTVPLRHAGGEVYAALTLVQNVTEQREAEDTTRRLLDLSRDLNATLHIGSLLDTLSTAAAQLTRAEQGHVHLVHPELVGDNRIGDRHFESLTAGEPELSRQLLRVPVVNLTGDTLGLLEVARQNEEAPFSDVERERLEGLGQIAAISLQNALSFQHLRRLSQQLVSAQEAERRSLSRELHDSTGQVLMALKMSLSMLHEEMAEQDPDITEQVVEIGDMVNTVYEEIRAVSHALRPPSLEVSSINEALQGLCEDYARLSGLEVIYEGCDPPDLPETISVSLYRLLQEALTNVAKHAQATKVQVRLRNGAGQIELSVHDDGVGFEMDEVMNRQRQRGVGLPGLRERFELLGGRMSVHSQTGKGTQIAGMYKLQGSS